MFMKPFRTAEFIQGGIHRNKGYSKAYNPYRHRGTPEQYTDWFDGWSEVDEHLKRVGL